MESTVESTDAVAERLAQLRGPDGGGAPLVLLLIDAYLDHTPGELDDLADALNRRDFPTVATKAHRLRGSAANIGAARLADHLAEIEAVGGTADGPDSDLLRDLRTEYETVSAILRDHQPGGGG